MIGELQTVWNGPVAFSSGNLDMRHRLPDPKGQRVWCRLDRYQSSIGVCTPQGSAYCLAFRGKVDRDILLAVFDARLGRTGLCGAHMADHPGRLVYAASVEICFAGQPLLVDVEKALICI